MKPPALLFVKTESRPHCNVGPENVLLLAVCLIPLSGHCFAQHQFCLFVLLVLHMCTLGTWGLREVFHWSCEFLCPSLRSCGVPVLSLAQKRLLTYCGSPLCCLQSPPLHFGFKKWCDIEAGCGQIWQSCQVFPRGINLQRATTTCHVPVLKSLAT